MGARAVITVQHARTTIAIALLLALTIIGARAQPVQSMVQTQAEKEQGLWHFSWRRCEISRDDIVAIARAPWEIEKDQWRGGLAVLNGAGNHDWSHATRARDRRLALAARAARIRARSASSRSSLAIIGSAISTMFGLRPLLRARRGSCDLGGGRCCAEFAEFAEFACARAGQQVRKRAKPLWQHNRHP